MANNGILSGMLPGDIKAFSKDFSQMLRVASEIDRYYSEWKHDLDRYLPKLDKLVKFFNRKYKSIKLKVLKRIDGVDVRILLSETTLKNLFNNCASRIVGLKSIGTKNFGAVDIAETERIANEINKIKDKLFLTYYFPEAGIHSIFLSKLKNEKVVELHWDMRNSILEASPDFQICAYYALKNGYSKKIRLFDEGATFGFTSLLSEKEKGYFFDRLNPRFLE
jgi:thiol-disulfide isomerase/thioredoxin